MHADTVRKWLKGALFKVLTVGWRVTTNHRMQFERCLKGATHFLQIPTFWNFLENRLCVFASLRETQRKEAIRD